MGKQFDKLTNDFETNIESSNADIYSCCMKFKHEKKNMDEKEREERTNNNGHSKMKSILTQNACGKFQTEKQ